MVNELIYTLIGVFIVSILSLVGIFTLSLNKNLFHKVLLILVAFAAGSMLGAAFFDLIPEILEKLEVERVMILIVLGILVFFIIERFIHWHHCHINHNNHKHHPIGYLTLIGDGVHNLGDGAIIAAAFLTDFGLGVVATIAILLHEIPQEISDFAILIKSGFSRTKAILFNFLTAITAFIGALITFYASAFVENIIPSLLAVAAGGFLYIAMTDLIPELKKEEDTKKLLLQTVFLIIGLVIIFYAGELFHHG